MSLAQLPAAPPLPAVEPSPAWQLVAQAADLAAQIAGTDFVPESMRNNPAAVAACMLYGAEIGIGPMMSLAKVDIVKGRPAPRAELARALALAAGHEMWTEEATHTRCKVSGRRRGSQKVQTVTWTMDDVRKAGISSHMYAKYPRQMLLARASAELARMTFPDVLGGISYFAEEIADLEPDNPATTPTAAAVAPAKQTRRRTPPTPPTAPPAAPQPPTVAPADEPPLDDELDDTPADDGTLSEAQMRKLRALYTAVGVTGAAEQKHATAVFLAIDPITTHSTLTVDQASTLIDTLTRIETGELLLMFDDAGRVAGAHPDEPADEQ